MSGLAAAAWIAGMLVLVAPNVDARAEVESDFTAFGALGWSGLAPELDPLGTFESGLSHAWQLGPLKPSVQLRGVREGFEDAPGLVDDLRNEALVRMDFALPHWPMLSVSYGREQRRLLTDSWAGALSDAESRTLLASLWYGFGSWEIYASSYFTDMTDAVKNSLTWSSRDHTVMLSYRPLPALALSLGGGMQQQRYGAGTDWLSSRSINASAYYTLDSHQISAYVWGSWIENDGAYGASGNRNYDFIVKLEKQLRTGWLPMPGRQFIGIEFATSYYQDMAYSRYSGGVSTGRILFRIEN